jgi:hypothetical protein
VNSTRRAGRDFFGGDVNEFRTPVEVRAGPRVWVNSVGETHALSVPIAIRQLELLS